jgi:hypothetical protein
MWTAEKTDLIYHHGGEALRECGILWFVFALLDRIVQGSVTIGWVLANGGGSAAVWMLGVMIALRENKR